MAPSAHAVLSPSAAERWISCPASIRVSEKILHPSESPYAAEGTIAHALAELELSLALGKITTRQYNGRYKKWVQTAREAGIDDDGIETMDLNVAIYKDLVLERAALFPDSAVLLEQRVSTGVPTCWGTSDTVIVSPIHVEIVDLKYGLGIPVSAISNPQLRLYGVGALEEFGDLLGEARVVRMTICQPRLNSISTEEMTADELRAWRDSIIPIAEEALGDNARFGPSDKACRWCPAAGECRARIEMMTQEDFGREPDLITNEELSELLERLPDIRRWVSAVEDAALRKVYSNGEIIPGWKVVMSGGRRGITDEEAAAVIFSEAGYDRSTFMREVMRGIGELEKLIRTSTGDRKVSLEDFLGDLVKKGEGKPSLVPESDSRPAVNPNAGAAMEFSREEE